MPRRNMRRVRAGSREAMFAADNDDVWFAFLTDSLRGGELRDREAVERRARRFLQAGPHLDPHEILISGARGTRKGACASSTGPRHPTGQ